MATMEEARKMKQKYESMLLKKKGVVGIATGFKIVGGERTPCVICYVEKKKPEKELKKEDIIPKDLEGIPTDVVESGPIRAL